MGTPNGCLDQQAVGFTGRPVYGSFITHLSTSLIKDYQIFCLGESRHFMQNISGEGILPVVF